VLTEVASSAADAVEPRGDRAIRGVTSMGGGGADKPWPTLTTDRARRGESIQTAPTDAVG